MKIGMWIGHAEYPNVVARAAREGWLAPLLAAHSQPCSMNDAFLLLRNRLKDLTAANSIPLPIDTRLTWRRGVSRGLARYNRRHGYYGISLPTQPGTRGGTLRLGLVLHEAAHVIGHRKHKRFGHGPEFCQEFRQLLETTEWRRFMKVSSYRSIYARHRGPFSILLTREVAGKKNKMEQASDRVEGHFNAEEAHEEARVLVNSPKENVLQAFVFSDSEGQFIGAFYERGQAIKRWSEEQEEEDERRLELPDTSQPRVPAALLREREESVRKVDAAGNNSMPKAAGPKRRPVRDVPQKAAAGPKRSRGGPLTLGEGDWPKSEGVQLVRATIEGVQLTTAELIEKITPGCMKLGVAFPASLVSRLKQAGLLKEIVA